MTSILSDGKTRTIRFFVMLALAAFIAGVLAMAVATMSVSAAAEEAAEEEDTAQEVAADMLRGPQNGDTAEAAEATEDAKPEEAEPSANRQASEAEPEETGPEEETTRVAAVQDPQPVEERQPTSILFESVGERRCIGGVLCESYCVEGENKCEIETNLNIRLDGPQKITMIQLNAHDNVGATRRARLHIKVDGKPAAATLVYRAGSSLAIPLNVTGQLITIESMHQHNGFELGGEEAIVWDVFVLGDKTDG